MIFRPTSKVKMARMKFSKKASKSKTALPWALYTCQSNSKVWMPTSTPARQITR